MNIGGQRNTVTHRDHLIREHRESDSPSMAGWPGDEPAACLPYSPLWIGIKLSRKPVWDEKPFMLILRLASF
jgi:hypothetical protein